MITLAEHKEPQNSLSSEKFFSPKKLYLPFSQHTGNPSELCLKVGDLVDEGQVVANKDGYISSFLHAPLKAKVAAVDIYNHPNLGRAETVVLETKSAPKQYSPRDNVAGLSKEELIEIVAQAGIVGMGGAAFPTAVKLKSPKPIETLIINGCECEPYLTCDHRLMVENLSEIFLGVEIVSKIVEAKKIIFALESNKADAIKQVNLLVHTKKFNLPETEVAVLDSKYPQGGEKQLIYSTTRRKVPGGKLPLDFGCLVHNVGTCFAIYEAVYYSKPLIERLVSFCGEALLKPKNIWVRIGTTLEELFDQKVLEFKSEPKKIICGGPMMGLALTGLDFPVLKSSGGFLFLTQGLEDPAEQPCLRCGRCVDGCPIELLPLEYSKLVKANQYDSLTSLNIDDCIECGVCAFNCPAKIPLVHHIKIGKQYAPKDK